MKMNFAEHAQKTTMIMLERSEPNRLVADGRRQAKKEEDKKSSFFVLCRKNKSLLADNADRAKAIGG